MWATVGCPSYGALDNTCPLELAHPTNIGIVSDWTIPPLSGWSGGKTLRDLVRGAKKPNDGTLTNITPSSTAGFQPPNRAGGYGHILFPGTTTKVVVPAITVPDITIATWINFTGGATFKTILTFGSSYGLWLNGSKMNFYNTGAVNTTQTTAITTGAWTHIAVTFNASTNAYAYYLNGNPDGSGTVSGGLVSGYDSIGSDVASDWLGGALDGLTVWKRALLPAQIREHFSQTKRGNPDRWRWIKGTAFFFPAAAGGTTYTASLAGSCAPSGVLTRSVSKALAGSSTATGALSKAASKPLSGSLTGAGALAKAMAKPLAGSSTATGSCVNTAGKGLAGSVTAGGVIIKSESKALAGSVTGTGALAKAAAKLLDGSSTPAGSLAKAASKAVAGSSAAAGSLTKAISKALAGSSTATGDLSAVRAALLNVAGSSTPAGSLSAFRTVLLALAGSLTTTGSLAKTIAKSIVGFLTGSGALTTVGGSTPAAPAATKLVGQVYCATSVAGSVYCATATAGQVEP